MERSTNIACLIVPVLAAMGTAQASRIFVDQNSVVLPTNGTSWSRAFHSVQTALAQAANGDEIWVADGTYTPAGPGAPSARTISFDLKPGVRLYGGFGGGFVGETSLAQRDPLAHPTILSGDINGDDTPSAGNMSDNSFHVVSANLSASGAVLDGFIIEHGNADGSQTQGEVSGAGLSVQTPTIHIVNCWFRSNFAQNLGDGADVFGGSCHFFGCVFTGNRAVSGAAISAKSSTILLQSSTVAANAVTTSSVSGAVHAADAQGLTLRGVVLWSNSNPGGQGQSAQLSLINTPLVMVSSDIQGGLAGLPGANFNISQNPGFVDTDGVDDIPGTADDDLRLRPLSPCIDHSLNTSVAADVSDMDGDGDTAEAAPFTMAADPRFHDDPGSTDIAIDGHPDIGAHEFQGSTCPGNLNGDGAVNTSDLTLFLSKFGQIVQPYTLGDFNHDGLVNTADLTLLLQRFGQTCPA